MIWGYSAVWLQTGRTFLGRARCLGPSGASYKGRGRLWRLHPARLPGEQAEEALDPALPEAVPAGLGLS